MTGARQAVILCGGEGRRLRPLTDTLPKPLAPVAGRPFLSYLLEQLRGQGITHVLLLTGYLGGMIRDRFGDGAALGVRLAYSHGPVDWDTGRRLWEARAQLDPTFLLLYSDNYVPVQLARLEALHHRAGRVATLLLRAKTPGNARVDAEGCVPVYDGTRSTPGLDHVEIGYMRLERDPVLAELETQPDVSLSRVLTRLAAAGAVGGLVTGDAYHSISDPDRWQLAQRYLAPRRLLLIDRDGTINERPPQGEYVHDWAAFRWVTDTVDAMRRLAARGFRFIVVSNQAGIGRGLLDPAAVADINGRMVETLAREGVAVDAVYVCPHHWEDGCACRKPAAGLFFQASRDHLVRLDRTIYIGDDPRDAAAADNAGCLCVLVGPDRQPPAGQPQPAHAAARLSDAEPWIVSTFDAWERDARRITDALGGAA